MAGPLRAAITAAGGATEEIETSCRRDGYVPAFAPYIRSGDHIYLSGRLGKEGGKLTWASRKPDAASYVDLPVAK